MTKLRRPLSIEDAIQRAHGMLLDAGVEAATGKSARLARSWSDPDDDAHRIPLHQAIAMDAACVIAGQPAPIREAYDAELSRAVEALGSAPNHTPIDLFDRLAQALSNLGDISSEVRAARHPDSQGRSMLTAAERADILRSIGIARSTLDRLAKDVEASE
ncbi:phage regulatory CII family protein [Paramagnetospirillum marisnigri]|nr:phage regulatory CII family protein [Paramagnetospirillum marisnigri]